jgi:hypothetical protein
MKATWEDLEVKIKNLEVEIKELKKLNHEENPANCEGILGYEEESPGDGTIGEYFNNEDFVGNPIVHYDYVLDFDCTANIL